MSQMGRPVIEIDFDQLDKLLAIQCTEAECAFVLGCSIDTIYRRVKENKGITFAEYQDEKRAAGRYSLRRKQFEVAMSGNVTMLIWLGKNILGQVEKIQNETHMSIDSSPQVIITLPDNTLLNEA